MKKNIDVITTLLSLPNRSPLFGARLRCLLVLGLLAAPCSERQAQLRC